MGGRKLSPGEVERRREALVPLFAYLADHGINALWVARRIGMRHGLVITRGRLAHIKRGACLTPPWFVADACREIGRRVEEVMGSAWVEAHREDLDGGKDGARHGEAGRVA